MWSHNIAKGKLLQDVFKDFSTFMIFCSARLFVIHTRCSYHMQNSPMFSGWLLCQVHVGIHFGMVHSGIRKHNSIFLHMLVVVTLLQPAAFLYITASFANSCWFAVASWRRKKVAGKCIAYYLRVVVQFWKHPTPICVNPLLYFCVLYCLYLYEVVDLHARCDYTNLYSSPFPFWQFHYIYVHT